MSQQQGSFKLKKKTPFNELSDNLILPESDLCFQTDDAIYQFEYAKPEDASKYEVKPGVFTLLEAGGSIILSKTELKPRNLLGTINNTMKIINEAKVFFSRLHVYERLGRPKKRGALLYSSPGMGKTSAIEQFCQDLIAEDAGTVVMIWPTSQIRADDVCNFLSIRSEFTAECSRLILIIEDIGGGERPSEYGRSEVTSGLLNLLDGVGVIFKLPTFIVATTNHPESLLSSLADRPGRFDLMISLEPPSPAERTELLKFIAKRDLTVEEVEAISSEKCNSLSIAHLEEIAVRAELHDKTYADIIMEMLNHSKLVKDAFEKKKTMGLNRNSWDD